MTCQPEMRLFYTMPAPTVNDGDFARQNDSPLAGWKHEEILAFIHYYKIPVPPIYGWKNGYLCGTHPWPARQWTGSEENGWREVYEIDESIVREAAQVIDSAAKFLKSL